MPRTRAEFLLAALVVLVIGIHLNYLLTVRTGVPHQDEWTGLYTMFEALDQGRLFQWVFEGRNGHFVVASKIGYLLALKFSALDFTGLRLFNFPLCLAGFALAAVPIYRNVRPRLRYYVYLGTALVVFNLCVWEHFTQAGAYSGILSAILGGIALWFLVNATTFAENRTRRIFVSLLLLLSAVLTFGLGYIAWAAAGALLAVLAARNALTTRVRAGIEPVVFGVATVMFLLALVSHPSFALKGSIFSDFYHFLLVLGSIGSAPFESGPMALNTAYVFGLLLLGFSVWVATDFLFQQREKVLVIAKFGFAMTIFGLGACGAVALARRGLPAGEFLSSRYTVQPLICLFGLLFYFSVRHVFLLTHVWCLIAASYLFATIEEWQVGPYRPAVYKNIEAAIRDAETLTDDQLEAALYWRENTLHVRAVAARLKKERLSFFREQE